MPQGNKVGVEEYWNKRLNMPSPTSNTKTAIEALQKIDELVSTSAGFEADCFIGLDKPRGGKPNPEIAEDWAKIIVKIFTITHPLLHKCCGGKLLVEKLTKESKQDNVFTRFPAP